MSSYHWHHGGNTVERIWQENCGFLKTQNAMECRLRLLHPIDTAYDERTQSI